MVGMLAVELFDTPEGVLVNELAMRPHNSGHWSIEGAVTSQFENHLRAVLDLPLGSPAARAPYTVMVNVLGGEHPDMYSAYRHVMARDPGLKVHMYGKDVRPGPQDRPRRRSPATTSSRCSHGPITRPTT